MCSNGAIILRGGNSTFGRVEICYDNVWWAVCANNWDNTDAAVACRLLGHSSVSARALNWMDSYTHARIWLSDVRCNTNEPRLITDCRSLYIIQYYCQVAGISCTTSK